MHRAPLSERLQGIGGKLRTRPDARRLKAKLIGLEGGGMMIFLECAGHFFPGRRLSRPRCRVLVHDHFAASFDYQFVMRFFHREKAQMIAEVIHPLGDIGGFWSYFEFALRKAVARQGPRLEARHMIADRDGILILVSGPVNNFVDHRPMVMGSVRAWLK